MAGVQYRLDLSLTGNWIEIRDADPDARAIYERHYSCRHYADGRQRYKFIGPGQYICLMTAGCDALFVWRKFKSMDNQTGINCAVFRNESDLLSSQLILEAERHAVRRWGTVRAYTYINGRAIRSTNPGFCFKVAGWVVCGRTKRNNLIILEKFLQ